MALFRKKLPITAFAVEVLPQVFQNDTRSAISHLASLGGFRQEELEPLARHILGLNVALWYGHAALQAAGDLGSADAEREFVYGTLGAFKKLGISEDDAWHLTERIMGLVSQYVASWTGAAATAGHSDQEWSLHFCTYFADVAAPIATNEGSELQRRAVALDMAWQDRARIATEVQKITKDWRLVVHP